MKRLYFYNDWISSTGKTGAVLSLLLLFKGPIKILSFGAVVMYVSFFNILKCFKEALHSPGDGSCITVIERTVLQSFLSAIEYKEKS